MTTFSFEDALRSPLDVALDEEGVTGRLASLARSIYKQESDSGRNTRTSNAGAVGGMQIIPDTFKRVADEDWDINDDVQNARAGLRYLKSLYERSGGDLKLTAAGYYGGEGGQDAAMRGKARRDPRNPKAPDTLEYANEVVARVSDQPETFSFEEAGGKEVILDAKEVFSFEEATQPPQKPKDYGPASPSDDPFALRPQASVPGTAQPTAAVSPIKPLSKSVLAPDEAAGPDEVLDRKQKPLGTPSMTVPTGKLIPPADGGVLSQGLDLAGAHLRQTVAGAATLGADVAGMIGADDVRAALNTSATGAREIARAKQLASAFSTDIVTGDPLADELTKFGQKYGTQIIAQLPQMGAAMMSGGIALPTIMSAFSAYDEARQNGVDPVNASVHALGHGFAEALGERLGGMNKVARAFEDAVTQGFGRNSVVTLGKRMLSAGAREVPSEEITTLMQFGLDRTTGGKAVTENVLGELGEEMKDTAIIAAGAGGVMGGAGAIASRVAGPTQRPAPSAQELVTERWGDAFTPGRVPPSNAADSTLPDPAIMNAPSVDEAISAATASVGAHSAVTDAKESALLDTIQQASAKLPPVTPSVATEPQNTETITPESVEQGAQVAGMPAVAPDQAAVAQTAPDATPGTPTAQTAPSGPETKLWTGRSGDGYASPDAAQNALVYRQKVDPAYRWSIEQNGDRYVLRGTSTAPQTTPSGFTYTANADGTVSIGGETAKVGETLRGAGVTSVIPETSGMRVGRSQAQTAITFLKGAPNVGTTAQLPGGDTGLGGRGATVEPSGVLPGGGPVAAAPAVDAGVVQAVPAGDYVPRAGGELLPGLREQSLTVSVRNQIGDIEQIAIRRLRDEDLPPTSTKGVSRASIAPLRSLYKALGKEIVLYDAGDRYRDVGDGFIKPDDENTIYLSKETSVRADEIVGHEFTHTLMYSDNPKIRKAYKALALTVAAKSNMQAAQREYIMELGYAPDEVIREYTADLGGINLRKPAFWHELMSEIERQHGEESNGIIQQIAQVFNDIVKKVVDAFKGQRGFTAAQYVNDAQAVRNAFRSALTTYMAERGIKAAQVVQAAQPVEAVKSAQREPRTRTIQIGGVSKPIENSHGQLVAPAHDAETLRNFHKWFSDSKVVDDQGRPLVVYHGTTKDFSTFRRKEGGRAIWAASADAANTYAGASDVYEGRVFGDMNVMPLYMSMSNPLVFDADGSSFDQLRFEGDRADPDDIASIAEERGHDGVIIKNLVDNDDSNTEVVADHYAVFKPEQVKSATGNRGTFDSSKPDITQSKQREPVELPASLRASLTAREFGKLRRDVAERLVQLFDKMPSVQEMAAVAWGGRAARGWYARSAMALRHVFGPDAPRFAALLAALSPQNSVQMNLENATRVWSGWVMAGRPTSRDEIVRIMGKNIVGNRGAASVLPAWINNSVRALTAEDPSNIVLSGPKVNSFMENLRGNVEEVTNDAWMAAYLSVDQKLFGGKLSATDPGKSSGYLAASARVRAAAAKLSKLTGETWTPNEVQETIWSWAKTLYEMQEASEGGYGAREIIDNGELRDELIAATPDFSSLILEDKYAQGLRKAGYSEQLDRLAGGRDSRSGAEVTGAGGKAAPFAASTQERLVRQAADRLERLRDERARSEAATRAAALVAQSRLRDHVDNQTIFEVAPDPRNTELKAQWDALPAPKKWDISRAVAADVVRGASAVTGIHGRLRSQFGGYGPDSNPSMAVVFPAGSSQEKIDAFTRVVGSALSQQAMMRTSPEPFPGSFEMNAIVIEYPKGSTYDELHELYTSLREIVDEKGEPYVTGHTTAEGAMVILDDGSRISGEELAKRIDEHLGGELDVSFDTLHAAFPEAGENDYDLQGQTTSVEDGTETSLRDAADQLREEAQRRLQQEIADRAEAEEEVATRSVPRQPRMYRGRELGKLYARDPVGRQYTWLIGPLGDYAYRHIGFAFEKTVGRALRVNPMNPKLVEMWREMKQEIDRARDTAATMAKQGIEEFPDIAERELLSDIIEKELKVGVTPPAHSIRMAFSMSNLMEQQTNELVRLGMLSADNAGRLRGRYLPRFYDSKMNQDNAWEKAVRSMLGSRKAMLGISGQRLKARGLWEFAIAREMDEWQKLGWEVRDKDLPAGTKTAKDIKALIKADVLDPTASIQIWRDFTRAEREKMGEIRDAVFRFTLGYMQTQKDIAVGHLFEAMANDAELSSKGPNAARDHTIQVPDTTVEGTGVKRYGKMAGRYVSPDIMSNLSALDQGASDILRTYRRIMGYWKEGKALALDTPIPTPTGWTTMGALQVGDMVFDENGKPCRVTFATDVQLNRECYRVEFSDGTSVVADAEHLWFTVQQNKGPGVRNTLAIKESLKYARGLYNQHSVPVAASLQLPDAALPVDPYYLGAWLGDGSSASTAISSSHADGEVVMDMLRERGFGFGSIYSDKRGNDCVTYTVGFAEYRPRANGLQPTLRALGVLNDKHIPTQYLRASERQRRDLLCGLMDTDGTIDENGKMSFCTTTPKLRDGVMELIRSLGYKPTCSVKNVAGVDCFIVRFAAYSDTEVFKLPRKAASMLPPPASRQRSQTRQIVSIEPVESVPVKCITVDSPNSLYLAGDFIPTHNTALNPVAHMNNTVSNTILAHFAGVPMYRPDQYALAIYDLANGDSMVKEAREAGLFQGTMSEEEFRQQLPAPIRDLASKGADERSKLERVLFGGDAKLADPRTWSVYDVLAWGLRKPLGAAYQAEDLFFRYLIYRNARVNGASPEEAVQHAQRHIFTYDDLPQGVRFARDAAIPFVGWTYKAIPVLLHTALAYPHRFALPIVALHALNTMSYIIAVGGDDGEEDWGALVRKYIADEAFRTEVRKREKLERGMLPKWMQGTTAMFTPRAIRLGMDEVTNLPLFQDVSRFVPGGDIFDVSPNISKSGMPIPQWLTPSHPLLTIPFGIIANEDLYFGKELLASTDSTGEKAKKMAGWLWRQTAPAIAIGNYHWDRWMNSLAQTSGGDVEWMPLGLGEQFKKHYTGVGRDGIAITPTRALINTFGWKIRPIDLERSEDIEKGLTKQDIRKLQSEIRSYIHQNNAGALSDELAEELITRAREKIDLLREGKDVNGKPLKEEDEE